MATINFREELGKVCPKAKKGADIYFFGCGNHFKDLRNWYRSMANINLEDSCVAFVDNDVNKQGTEFYGKPIISPDVITPENSVVMITVADYPDYIIDRQMMDKGFIWKHDLFACAESFHIIKRWIYSRTMKFKDIHKNERCFIIGGGPSLFPSDLDILANEKTFAMNRIYKIFDKTKWRPTYYVTTDAYMIQQFETINENISGNKFLAFNCCLNAVIKNNNLKFENANYFSVMYTAYNRPTEYRKIGFGEYPDFFYGGCTSTYACLQLAVFMGFKEIYLLGMDNEYSMMLKNNGEYISTIKKDYFTENYHNGNLVEKYGSRGFMIIPIDVITSAYQSAKEYADTHGIKIYNATRGGKLEIFERVDFDSLF